MFADPQSVSIAGTANALPRVSEEKNGTLYANAEGTVSLSIAHTNGKRKRSQIRLTQTKVAADPFMTGINREYSQSTYLVIDRPLHGFTAVEQKDLIAALAAYLTSGTTATRFAGGEA